MKNIAAELKKLVSNFAHNHRQLTEETTTLKLDQSKWTLKEILGHLIDSASNNHQRITRLQLVEELSFPGYETEKWVKIEKWNLHQWEEILNLFQFYNLFLSHLIENVNPDCLKNRWLGQDQSGGWILTLEELVTDYLRHFKEHLEHFEKRWNELLEKGT